MKTKYNGAEKRAVWVWCCDKPHGGYLFRGNPNVPRMPPYHLGNILTLVDCGHTLVTSETRKTLEMESGVLEWNLRMPFFEVKPKCVMIEIRPYYKRKEKAK